MDSRTSSILINLDLNLDLSNLVANQYTTSKAGIEESESSKCKVYKSLRSTIKECYLTGSLKYGNNFVM